MYYDNNSNDLSELENERILKTISDSPLEACSTDPSAKAAFEESLRHLAEDIIEYNPALAHILLGLGGEDGSNDFNGRN